MISASYWLTNISVFTLTVFYEMKSLFVPHIEGNGVVQMTFLEIIHLLQTFTTTSRLLQTSNVQQIQRKFYFLEFWVVLKWAWTHLHFIAPPAMLMARITLIHYMGIYLMYFRHLCSVVRRNITINRYFISTSLSCFYFLFQLSKIPCSAMTIPFKIMAFFWKWNRNLNNGRDYSSSI